MSTGRKLLFSLLSLVLFVAGAEVALRAMGWPKIDDGAEFAHRQVYWVSDPELREAPTLHKELGVSFPVSTDKNGLRAPLHDEAKPAGVLRVMTLGCSTTFGWGVADAESYPAKLEELLRAAGHSQVEVINGGQPGYTSFQGRWLWDKVLSRYEPDVVLLGYIVQDARKAAYSDLSQAVLMREAAFLKANVLYSWRLYLAMKVATGAVVVRTKERAEGGEAGVFRVSEQEYLDNLRYLRARITETGAEVVHFGFPLEVVGYTETHRRLLRLEAEAAGVRWFDPSEQVEAEAARRTLFFPQDRGHPNADGTRLIAELVRDYLVREKLVGGP